MRRATMLVLLALGGCAEQGSAIVQPGRAAGPFAMAPTGIPVRVQRPAPVLAQYEAAVAAGMQATPGTAHFRQTFVVRHPLGEEDGLCGEVSGQSGPDEYTAFFAPVTQSGDQLTASPWFASRIGASTVDAMCGLSGTATPAPVSRPVTRRL